MVATGVLPWVSVLAAGMTRNQLAMSMVTISGVVTVILTDDHGTERVLRLADSQTRTWRPGDRIALGVDGVPLRANAESHGGT